MSGTTQVTLTPAAKPVESFLPATFLERGVMVPFTTPQLNGARARPGERMPLELIIPNPSGGRGVYIVPLEGVQDFCALTINDRRLADAIAKLRGVTPDTIREAAREVAREGLAGRGAVAAAKQAQTNDELAKIQANFDLLISLVLQTERKGEEPIPVEKSHPTDLEYRGRRAVARIAARLGCTQDRAAAALEQLAAVFQGVGVRNAARIPRELETLTCLRRDVRKFSENAADTKASEAQLVAVSADLTILLVTATLADARALVDDIKTLIRHWVSDPTPTMQLLARPDWLLDGWNRICALWSSATDPEDAVSEMAALVPVIPREAEMWSGHRVGHLIDVPQYRRTVVRQLEDWRTGVTVTDLVARNESLFERSL
jgi:hypothetical protein